jgi:putative PEP-CTERM system histidine kinase
MLDLGFVSYGLAATSFLILTLLLLTSWQGRSQGARLVVACAVTSAWAALLAFGSSRMDLTLPMVMLAESLRYGAWFIVLTGLTRSAGLAGGLSRAVHVTWMSGVALAFGLPALVGAGVPVPDPMLLIIGAGLLMALLGLVLLEQVYRNSRAQGRYAIKFFVIAMGVMFAYDLFLYSQAQLLKSVDAVTWAARGFVLAMTVPMLALAARRNPHWSLDVFVSRQVVFYTTSILAIGLYLLLMASGGYFIRLYGGTWGRVAQLVFFAGAAAVLVSLVASSALRRRLRVFISKHFYRNKYDYRIEWLRFIDTLSAPVEGIEVRANAVRAIAQIIGSPGGVLYLRDDAGGHYQPAAVWPGGDDPAGRFPVLDTGDEFVEFLARRQWVVDAEEHARSPDTYQNVMLPGFICDDRERHRFVLPLVHGADMIGFMALAAPPPPFNPTFEDRDLLKTVGRHVATHLAQHETDRQLADSRQFEAYHRLTAFVMHDLKNLAAQLSLIVSNAEKHRRNPEFVDDAISTIANSTGRMQRLIEQLQRREVQTTVRRVSLGEIARRAVDRCRVRLPEPVFEGDGDGALVEADQERLTMIVEHVIRNAQEATPDDGRVAVSVGSDGEWHSVVVNDSGAGMSPEFVRDRLFKPFDTTKGSKGMGIGAYQVREYVQSLGGRVLVESREGEGTRIELHLPAQTANLPTDSQREP